VSAALIRRLMVLQCHGEVDHEVAEGEEVEAKEMVGQKPHGTWSPLRALPPDQNLCSQ
jgi:hypothetical protein